ncbi:hypothetical protein DICSQDRAFT_143418 [Dichomitus squalens LYAD-421 SS1]|uniref:uncharacterized protein n=1 Tax=Dichomitus squalens (strain LYAD-421) TaxID=732165 RepID=UPI0004414DA2|nr:uncharacterized protein DICSQDRAFT_143418 [Dichomitus squalens LYAD-421 SS1]EJF66063.1 hypothetical protein DICSQDRAFT_143418 [Dichomitus squalens LYAD-421 SS1]
MTGKHNHALHDEIYRLSMFSILASRPTLAVIHKDFQSLLTLIYTSTTKVTLVLRPTEPAPNAALAPIRDLGTSITSLATCATLFHLYGTTLASETRLLASDVIEAVRSLAMMFVEDAGGDYLVRTGAVHDMVEKARRELPADNIAAVRKRWRADRGMLEDSLEDINAMVEDAGEGEDLDADELDDEWDELGFGSTKKMSDDELERTKKIQPLVRFVTLLHKRVVPDVLGSLSNPPPSTDALNQALDILPSLSKSVVVAVEEVVAALYAPQKPAALAASISTLVETIHAVHTSVTVDMLLPPADLERAMGALSMDSSKGGGEKAAKDPRKWFESCLAQIDKSAKAVGVMLQDQVNNGTS